MILTSGEFTIQQMSVAILAAIITLFCTCRLNKYTLFMAMFGYVAVISMFTSVIAERMSQRDQATALAILIAIFCFELLFIVTPISKKGYDEVARDAIKFRAIVVTLEAREELRSKEGGYKLVQDEKIPEEFRAEFWRILNKEFHDYNMQFVVENWVDSGKNIYFTNLTAAS